MIEAKNINKYFSNKNSFWKFKKERIKAVDDVSFYVEKGKTFGLVGESGCGKTTLAKIMVNILKADSGKISIKGDKDMVFQDPNGSLNPRMTVSDIVGEPLLVRKIKKTDIKEKTREVLEMVKLNYTAAKNRYPHQFSGGERQRIAIARALIRKPDVLVLDEPVSSLDVSIQAEILNLLKDLQDELSLTYVFISHDLRVVEFMSDTVGVMKDGRLIEIAPQKEIYTTPQTPYTRALLNAIPKL